MYTSQYKLDNFQDALDKMNSRKSIRIPWQSSLCPGKREGYGFFPSTAVQSSFTRHPAALSIQDYSFVNFFHSKQETWLDIFSFPYQILVSAPNNLAWECKIENSFRWGWNGYNHVLGDVREPQSFFHFANEFMSHHLRVKYLETELTSYKVKTKPKSAMKIERPNDVTCAYKNKELISFYCKV